MVEIKSIKGDLSLTVAGSVTEVLADLGIAIAAIYDRLRNTPTGAAEEFRNRLTISLVDPDSPIWNHAVPPDPNGLTVVIPVQKSKGELHND